MSESYVNAGLPAYGLKPAAELAAERPHGDRVRYIAGCRCPACRAANTAYTKARVKAGAAGEWNGIVFARDARAHINKLTAAGVGLRSIQAACDVPRSTLRRIASGVKDAIRASTEKRILAVTEAVAGDHALIAAAPTWKLIHALVSSGHTKVSIARAIGQSGPALQVGKAQVTVRVAYRIEQLHRQLLPPAAPPVRSGPTLRRIAELRDECFTDRQIERAIGMPIDAITQPTVSADVERAVREAYERLMG